jgi:uncharacterized protein YuzE
VLVDLDEQGRLVSITLEHAKQQTDVNEFSYQLAARNRSNAITTVAPG